MKHLTPTQIEKGISKYCVPHGVQEDNLLPLFKELGYGKRELNRFHKWMKGQTLGVIGDKCIYYSQDLYRFLTNECKSDTEIFD